MNFSPPAFENKICEPDQLASRLNDIKRPLVFTNGCFDILHRGHVTYLAQAAALGESLVVALNSDASVKRQGKGDDRPINSLQDRMALMAALECVTLVTWFDEDTPLNVILALKPDVLVKGGDWSTEKVYSIPFLHARSTTATLNKIRSL
jgi:rfaE bifunctional protein nucleotidyltransferase chain/domain